VIGEEKCCSFRTIEIAVIDGGSGGGGDSDRNNTLKYKNLSIEIQRMWYMKCVIMPLTIGVTGIETKRLKEP
jgi:hypothetical protein